jgi:hypothetical protein
MDVVITSTFFGVPIDMSTMALAAKLQDRLQRLSTDNHTTYQQLKQELNFDDFLHFTAQTLFRSLVSENGHVAHFVLANEPGPDIEMAKAAGLELKDEKQVGSAGTLYCFVPQSTAGAV